MTYTRLDGWVINDRYVCECYFGILSEDNYEEMLEALRVARRWNLTLEEFNEWMDSPNDDMAQLYFHNIFCDCGSGYHIDNILWSMGAMGTAHVERKNTRGTDWKLANA